MNLAGLVIPPNPAGDIWTQHLLRNVDHLGRIRNHNNDVVHAQCLSLLREVIVNVAVAVLLREIFAVSFPENRFFVSKVFKSGRLVCGRTIVIA